MTRPNKGTETSIRILCSKKWKREVEKFAAQVGQREEATEGNMSEVVRRATSLYMRVGVKNLPSLENFAGLLSRKEDE